MHTVFEPAFANSGIAVASANDGNLISLNTLAKNAGLKMGDPLFKVEPIIKKHDVKIFSSSFYLYGDLSRRVMQCLSSFSEEQEIYSIDECWLSLSGIPGDLSTYGNEIAQTVKQWTGIPVSIGIAPTKTLTKVATRLVKKKLIGPGSVCEWNKLQQPETFLETMPVTDIWGISSRLGAGLGKLGIQTALQLKCADPAHIRRYFGVTLERLVRELNGTACIPLELVPPPKKQIMVSRSFGNKLKTLEEIRPAISNFAELAGEKLRRQMLLAGAISVFVQTGFFDRKSLPYSNATTIVFSRPTSDTASLIRASMQGLSRIYKNGFSYSKAGVMLMDLTPSNIDQMRLFDDADCKRENQLMDAIDKINLRYGRNTIKYGSAYLSEAWRMRQNYLSPAYTTRWHEIPIVKA